MNMDRMSIAESIDTPLYCLTQGGEHSAVFGQGLPQRLSRPPHLRHVRLVPRVRGVQIGSAEDAILTAVHAHETAAAAAEA